MTDFAGSTDRGVAAEPIGGNRIGFARQRFFGMLPQLLLPRPIGILLDKIGNVGKPAGCAGASAARIVWRSASDSACACDAGTLRAEMTRASAKDTRINK